MLVYFRTIDGRCKDGIRYQSKAFNSLERRSPVSIQTKDGQ